MTLPMTHSRKAGLLAIAWALLSLAFFGLAAHAATDARLEEYCGVYQLPSKKLIYIQPWPGGGGQFTFTDDAGEVRSLFPAGDGVFSAGAGLAQHSPVAMKLTFQKDHKGRVTGAIREDIRAGPSLRQTAKKLTSYRREAVSFASGTERLAGVLLLPPGKGPHPVLVLVHGSGATDRNNVLPITQFLLGHGMALLGYDKRGVGESTGGDWKTASLDELAQDAATAAAFLKTRREIDPKRIGVLGVSQGGWVAPLAASRSKDISYVISVSGPAVSPSEVERDRLEHALHARSFSEGDIQEALSLLKLRESAALEPAILTAFQEAIERVKGRKWFPLTATPAVVDQPQLEHWRRLPPNYDPAPVLSSLRVPVLVLFGALDQNVMPQKNAEKWQAALDSGGNKDRQVTVFPQANHMLLEARTGRDEEFPILQRFAPEYAPLIVRWLRSHLLL